MADQNFKAEKISRYRKLPVDPNLVLIDTGKKPFGSSTFVYRIIRECLADTEPGLRVALITDSFEIYEHGLQEFFRDSRFFCLLPDTDACYRCYCTAGRIYSAGWLPGFFSKRKGQRVALFLPPDQYGAGRGVSRPVFNRAASLRMADDILDTSQESYYRDTPEQTKKDTLLVYFTANGPLYGSNLLNLIQFHKAAGGIAAAEQLKLIYVVPPSLWKTCRERRESLPFENMLPATDDFAPLLASAAAVLTVPGRFLDYAQGSGVPCLVYTGRVQNGYPSCRYVYSWEGIESAFRAFVSEAVSNPRNSLIRQPEAVPEQIEKNHREQKHILLVTDWPALDVYRPFLKFWAQNALEQGCSVDILLRTLGKVSRKSVETAIPEDIDVFLYSDECSLASQMREQAEFPAEECLRDTAEAEWIRILGNTKYDTVIIGKGHADCFWDTMYRFLSCSEIQTITPEELPIKLAPLFVPNSLKSHVNAGDLLSIAEYHGRQYYRLGCTENGFLYGEKSFEKDDFVLCLYHGGDLEYCFSIWKNRYASSHLVVVNTTGRAIPARKDRQIFSEYRLTGLPVSLLLCCRAFLCAKDCTEMLLSAMLGIPADCPSGVPVQIVSSRDTLKLAERSFWSGLIWDTSVPNPLEN